MQISLRVEDEGEESEGAGAHAVSVVDGLRRGRRCDGGGHAPGEERGARASEPVEEPAKEHGEGGEEARDVEGGELGEHNGCEVI